MQVPEVHVTAKAFLPSTSLVTFTLGGGLSFTTFVNTIPISGGWVGGGGGGAGGVSRWVGMLLAAAQGAWRNCPSCA